MPRFECSVCKLQPADLAAVEVALAAGTKFRELAQKCGVSKSTLHRHWSRCVNRRRLSEIKQRRTGLTVESRVAVWWPDSPEPQDCDVIIKVTYAPLEPESVKNPAALRAADAVEAER